MVRLFGELAVLSGIFSLFYLMTRPLNWSGLVGILFGSEGALSICFWKALLSCCCCRNTRVLAHANRKKGMFASSRTILPSPTCHSTHAAFSIGRACPKWATQCVPAQPLAGAGAFMAWHSLRLGVHRGCDRLSQNWPTSCFLLASC